MHDTNRGGLDRRSDNGGSKVATERTPAISGLIGLVPTFSPQLNNWGPWRPWIVPSSSGQEVFRAMSWRRHARNALGERYDERARALSRCLYSPPFSRHAGSRIQPFHR